MEFAVIYDEVNQLYHQLFINMSFSETKFHLIISAISARLKVHLILLMPELCKAV